MKKIKMIMIMSLIAFSFGEAQAQRIIKVYPGQQIPTHYNRPGDQIVVSGHGQRIIKVYPGQQIPTHYNRPGDVIVVSGHSQRIIKVYPGQQIPTHYNRPGDQIVVSSGHGYGTHGQGYGHDTSGGDENVVIRSREQWGPDGGSREFDQQPSTMAKLIDAAKALGVVAIIYR
jgi:hypothetical protein